MTFAGGTLTARVVDIDVFHSRLDEAYALFAEHYEGTDRARFEHDLADKHVVILLEDAHDGVLRGFSTVHVSRRRDARGRKCTLIFSGDTVIHRSYWGQGQLQSCFSKLLLQQKLRHPGQPLYWFLICKGYKTYLLLVNHVASAIPRRDIPEPPARLQEMLDLVATERFGDRFDRKRGLVVWRDDDGHEHVRADLGIITDELIAAEPHVAYFVERNPQYARGDELVCLGDMTLWTMVRETGLTAARAVAKARRARARRVMAPSR